MASQAPTRQGSGTPSKDTVAKKFVDMYYGILNNSHELMYRFYRPGSTVTVSEAMENGTTVMESADTEETVRELVKSIFADVTIKVDTTVPQFSMEGSVLILVSGTIQRTDDETRRMFSQAFLLAPQENGYYVLTDSMQILGHSSSPILKGAAGALGEQVHSGDQHDGQDVQRMVPITPRSQVGQGMVPPPLSSQPPRDFMDAYPDRPDHRHVPSLDLQSHTPPVHETQMELPDRSPPIAQAKADRQSYAHALAQGPVTEAHVPGRMHPQEMIGTANLMAGPGNMGRLSLNDAHRSFGTVSNTFGQGGAVPHRHRRSNTSDGRLLHPVSGHGVFIARLPFGTEAADVVEVMGQFGTVVGGVDGVQVRDGRNGCYAFVSFDTLEAAEAAIRGPVKFGGKQVFIERKYSTADGQQMAGSLGLPHAGRGGGRGRPGPGSRRTGSIG